MNDAEDRFAERLADDLRRVLGIGIVVGDVELALGEDGAGRVEAILISGPRVETIEAAGASVGDLYEPIVRRAAELRLNDAFWQIIGPA